MFFCACIIYGSIPIITAELRFSVRDCMAYNENIYYLATYKKGLMTSALPIHCFYCHYAFKCQQCAHFPTAHS